MNCDFESDFTSLLFIVGLVVTNGSLLFNLLSLFLLSFIRGIDSSLHHILFSFQTANLIGASLLTHDVLSLSCGATLSHFHDKVSISALLSISHMTLLLMSY